MAHGIPWLDESPLGGLPDTGEGTSVTVTFDAAHTSHTTVAVGLSATDAGINVALMRFSNNNVGWSDWEAYAMGKNWMLHAGDGLRAVYVQYRDELGNVSADGISDDITSQIHEEMARAVECWWLYR
ncbi:hypothetical protein ACFL34_00760 [Candidatus Sumerlaeota bacterium]